ncbi:MAG: A/G-specific adenine glycosylase [Lachnospiraceae bacterium]
MSEKKKKQEAVIINELKKEIVPALLSWYDYNARILPWRSDPTPYHVWISEIMLQQTRVEAVKPYYDRFLSELPDIEALAKVEDEKLMKLWQGLGYYNRARNLKTAAMTIMNEYDGVMPRDYEKILSLKGIGEYTAGAISSIAYQIPVPAVDGNVLRVISRVEANDEDILKASTKKRVREELLEIMPKNRAGDFNQALMELGATVCLPNGKPLCEKCPWDTVCQAYKQGKVMDFPVKQPKKKRKIEQRTVFLLYSRGRIALRKRPDTGLLAGLWEFPNEVGKLEKEEIRQKLGQWGITRYKIDKMAKGKHIFSHIEWQMRGYFVDIEDGDKVDWKGLEFEWISLEEMERSYAIPSAYELFLRELEKKRKGELDEI